MSEKLRLESIKQDESRSVRELMGLDTLSMLRDMGFDVTDRSPSPAVLHLTEDFNNENVSESEVDNKSVPEYKPHSVRRLEIHDD